MSRDVFFSYWRGCPRSSERTNTCASLCPSTHGDGGRRAGGRDSVRKSHWSLGLAAVSRGLSHSTHVPCTRVRDTHSTPARGRLEEARKEWPPRGQNPRSCASNHSQSCAKCSSAPPRLCYRSCRLRTICAHQLLHFADTLSLAPRSRVAGTSRRRSSTCCSRLALWMNQNGWRSYPPASATGYTALICQNAQTQTRAQCWSRSSRHSQSCGYLHPNEGWETSGREREAWGPGCTSAQQMG